MEMNERIKAAAYIAAAVADAIDHLGEIPEGHLYANLCGKMSLETFNSIISLLQGAGRITVRNHMITSCHPVCSLGCKP